MNKPSRLQKNDILYTLIRNAINDPVMGIVSDKTKPAGTAEKLVGNEVGNEV